MELPEYNMRGGLIALKSLTRERLTEFGEVAVLLSGLQGSGKSCITSVLAETNFGRLVGGHLCSLGEISANASHSLEGLLRFAYLDPDSSKKLFLADVMGAANIQRRTGPDRRLIVAALSCNFLTRSLNLSQRNFANLAEALSGGFFRDELRQTLHSFPSEIFPVSIVRDVNKNTLPDLIINTSIGSRIARAEAREALLES